MPVESGNLVSRPSQKSLILSFITKLSIDEYNSLSFMNCLYCFATPSGYIAVIHYACTSVSQVIILDLAIQLTYTKSMDIWSENIPEGHDF